MVSRFHRGPLSLQVTDPLPPEERRGFRARRSTWRWAARGRSQGGQFREQDLMPRLAEDDRALLRSQSGPLAGMSFSTVPARIDSQAFRVLLLRLAQDADVASFWYGHHRASCATAGVLGRRGFAVENAAARICREAGGRVSTNVWVRDLDLRCPSMMHAGWRLLLMGCHSMAALSWLSTPPVCPC